MGDECYAPTRGLTVPLRTSYAQEVSELAVKAERDHGVPAPILAAMAIDESGYGTIRVALAANIIFSFKWISATQAGGRSDHTLSCQPPEDKGNTNIVFKDHADSIDFAAGKLEKLEVYKLATETYKQAANNGNKRRSAATTWLNTKQRAADSKPGEADARIDSDDLPYGQRATSCASRRTNCPTRHGGGARAEVSACSFGQHQRLSIRSV